MNTKTEQAIKRIIERTQLNRHSTILTIHNSRSTLPLDLAGIGHRVLVTGSEFRKLYSLWKKGKKAVFCSDTVYEICYNNYLGIWIVKVGV